LWFKDRKCLRLNYLEVVISIWNVDWEENDGSGWEKKISFLMEKDSSFLMEREIFFVERQQKLCWQEGTWSGTEKNMTSEISVILSERIFEEEILISMIVGDMVFFEEILILNEIPSEEI